MSNGKPWFLGLRKLLAFVVTCVLGAGFFLLGLAFGGFTGGVTLFTAYIPLGTIGLTLFVAGNVTPTVVDKLKNGKQIPQTGAEAPKQ